MVAASSDRHLGIGFNAANAGAHRGEWGENIHGKAIMAARERLRLESAETPEIFAQYDTRPGAHRLYESLRLENSDKVALARGLGRQSRRDGDSKIPERVKKSANAKRAELSGEDVAETPRKQEVESHVAGTADRRMSSASEQVPAWRRIAGKCRTGGPLTLEQALEVKREWCKAGRKKETLTVVHRNAERIILQAEWDGRIRY